MKLGKFGVTSNIFLNCKKLVLLLGVDVLSNSNCWNIEELLLRTNLNSIREEVIKDVFSEENTVY